MNARRWGSIDWKDGHWRIRYTGTDGKRHIEFVDGTKRQAEARRMDLWREVTTGLWCAPSDLTIGQLLELWLASKPRLATTELAYRKEIARLLPICGHWKVQATTKLHHAEAIRRALETWQPSSASGAAAGSDRSRGYSGQQERQSASPAQGPAIRGGPATSPGIRQGSSLAPKTVRETLSRLSQAFGYALSHEWVRVNPFTLPAFEMPKSAKPETHGRAESLNPEEARKLWAACERAPEDLQLCAPLVQFALGSPRRYNELAGLRWSDVDRPNMRYTVNQMYDRVTHSLQPSRSAKNRQRTYSLTPLLVGVLNRQEKLVAARYVKALDKGWLYRENLLVFPTLDGRPMPPMTLSNQLRRLCDLAGVPRVSIHRLRHTANSVGLSEGNSDRDAQALGGWDTPAMVSHYAHRFAADDQAAAERLSRGLSG